MKIKLTFLFLCFILLCHAQEISTTYYKSNGKPSKKVDKAEYVEKILKTGDKYSVKRFLIKNNKPILDSELKSMEPYIEDGLTIYYDKESDDILAKGLYRNGTMDSIWIYKGQNNNFDKVDYSIVDNRINSTSESKDKVTYSIVGQMPFFCYFKDLKIRRDILDKQFQQFLTSKQYNTADNDTYLQQLKPILDLNRFAFELYLKNHLYYPMRAKQKGIKGSVYAQFVVDETGKIVEVKVIRGIDKDLDLEAKRCILSMPVWIAGNKDGQTVRVSMLVEVKFEL